MLLKSFYLQVAGTCFLTSFFSGYLTASESPNKFTKDYLRPKSIPYADDNAYSKDRENLGKMLYFDPRLSGSSMISCASCHNPSFNWTDALPKAVGHKHETLGRKSPTILNLAWTTKLMWDGRFNTLEDQALGPISSPGEMNMSLEGDKGLMVRVNAIEGYKPLFAKAYPGEEVNPKLIGKAIGVFERGIISGKSRFDQFVEGKRSALSASEKNGFVLFNTKANCASCHSGWSFSDGSFHDIGVPGDDLGRGKFLKLNSQQHAFKTPGLRNIAERGPYMHDGSEATLTEVIDFYDAGGKTKRESLSSLIKPLGLSASEKQDLIAFLGALTSKDKTIDFPILPK